MATLTIRKLGPALKERLRAAQRGHSIEEEAPRILSESRGPAGCDGRPAGAACARGAASTAPPAYRND